MSSDYLLNFSTTLHQSVLIDDIKDKFSLDTAKSDSNWLNNSKGLYLCFIYLDEEDKNNAMEKFGMSLNQRVYLLHENTSGNYIENTRLMYEIVAYVLEMLDGDISFTYESHAAILERRSGVLAVNKLSFEYYSQLADSLTLPYVIKPLEIMELSDE
jgi:hypothetical protein